MGNIYRLGFFGNVFPTGPEDETGIFMRRTVDALTNHNVDVITAVKTNRSVFGYFPFLVSSLTLCFRRDIDLLQAHYIPHSGIIPALFKGRRPLVLKFHGDDARIYPFKSPVHRLLIQLMIKRSDYVITASEEMRGLLIRIGADPKKIRAIASGVDTNKYIPMNKEKCKTLFNIRRECRIFLYVGRYHPWKGIYELIAASRYFPEDLFFFAGDGVLPDHPDNCIDIGRQNPDLIPKLMNTADCLILPSYTEGIPNVLMEALSCATPAITTGVGGCPEVVKDGVTGLIIPSKNVSALVNAIRWMTEHPDERKMMGEEGRRDMMERYEIEKLIKNMIDIHRTLLGGAR